ncbi:uncharacterized protein BJ171DRAFT_501746 [Polychytrium aggregatum]|uniref:uncharacterized protein n=1 Tax=Polychytrium aggregatum TaxID=110093 RepID=UPI0022FEFD88|nr:uncharacterized protein BJ171DRAFT_501746 [Polychytrium aggregatum]KAI9205310.1 hypothetical protein BJ171DRAFT_501746 [Polychytrium aggregatum]
MSYARREEDGKDIIVFVTKEDSDRAFSSKSDSQVSTKDESSSDLESSQKAAYNPETGEINWDCPCLGGMTKPPCGETFKAAFSCFVYSTTEPKGIDCIEQFQAMQSCFREYPDIYGAELADDDDESAAAPKADSKASTDQ